MKTITLPNGFSFPMIEVPGGTFTQGPREVTLSDFELGQYPVTQALWEAVMGEGSNPSRFVGPRRPVEQESWYDAVAFCNRLNALEKLPVCYFADEKCTRPYALEGELPNKGLVYHKPAASAFRLPTEAEWEYAARGGPFHTKTKNAGSDREKDVAWYFANRGRETHTIGLKQPNALGLYDMSGNVWEWCWDWYGEYQKRSKPDPLWPESGERRVLRGGSWYVNSWYVRVSNRDNNNPVLRYFSLGFRLARTAS